MKIILKHVYPPIPIRSFDWCAFVEGSDEETRICGWGEIEKVAIADLKDNLEVAEEMKQPWPKRCKTNMVDHEGACWHCYALSGEVCREKGE